MLALPGASWAAVHPPQVSTDKVEHVRGVTALLTGSVNPEGSPTTYYFQFGPTPAYGSVTAVANAGSGTKLIKVGLQASPVLVGYHFRLVATNAGGTKVGHDRIYVPRKGKLKIELPKGAAFPWGSVVVVSGRISGAGGAHHRIELEDSPYPYKEAFEPIGLPSVTDALGRFSFRVGVLRTSTQFRVVTLDPLPKYSRVMTAVITVRVTLKVKSSSRPGFVRMFGMVTPVSVGSRVEIQLQKAVRPGHSEKTEERTTRFSTTANTTVKHATKRFSFYSAILSVPKTGYYRVVVVVRKGGLGPGTSRTLLIHAPKSHRRSAKH